MTYLPGLQRRVLLGDLDLTGYPFAVEFGMGYDAGELVTSVLSSLLQDGDLEVSQRRGNMVLSVPVLTEGVDLGDLAKAEALLAIEAQKPTNTLTIDPGDGFGPPTVFDTFQADPAFNFADIEEQSAVRRFAIRIPALPFGRSHFKVVAAATNFPASPTTVLLNDGSSATAWSSRTGAAAGDGNAVSASGANTANLTLNSSFDLTGTRWIVADWRDASEPGYGQFALQVRTSGGLGEMLYPSRTDALPNGYKRSHWFVPSNVSNAVTALEFTAQQVGGSGVLYIDRVSRTSSPSYIGTNRQQSRIVEVAGSARTQGGVQIYSPSTSLGDVMVYTSSGGFTPNLSGFRAGPVTTDSSRVSGGYVPLSVGRVFDVPVSLLAPGLYSLVALVSAPAGDVRTLSWTTATQFGSVPVGRTVSGAATTSSSDYRFVPLGNINLPTDGVRSGTSAIQRVTLIDPASGSTALLDELYLCNLTTGRLTIASCGTGAAVSGGPSSRLWLDAATVATRTPTVMRGTAADGSDAFFVGDGIQTLGLHEFVPPAATIFTACTNATDSQVTLDHYPRWLGHAALPEPA